MYQYLKDKQEYNDRYDRMTVDHCRMIERSVLSGIESLKNEKGSQKDKEQAANILYNVTMFYETGGQWEKKEETIQKWMDRDRKWDEHQERAVAPLNIHCPSCSSQMKANDGHLEIDHKHGHDRVLFFFECPACGKRKGIYEDGTELIVKPTLCGKCGKETKIKRSKQEKRKITTYYTCPHCGHEETDVFELSVEKKEKPDPYYEEDRARFCLTDEQGKEYLKAKLHWEQFKALIDEIEERDKHKDIYEEAAKIEKLSVFQVQEKINQTLSQQGFANTQYGKPEIGREIVISLSFQDTNPMREEYDSKKAAKKATEKALIGSNWRLMSDGFNYRLGYLEGRIKGVDSEEELVKLTERYTKLAKEGKIVLDRDGNIITL